MKHVYLILTVLTAMLATGCATPQTKTEEPEKAPPVSKPAPAKESTRKEPAKKEVVRKEVPVEGEIVGKPASDSKFAKLKIGMTLNQVEKLIGPPTRQSTHPTGKASIPFYFGPDRWVIQYSYKHEGVLTLNSGGDQVLIRIEVNKAE